MSNINWIVSVGAYIIGNIYLICIFVFQQMNKINAMENNSKIFSDDKMQYYAMFFLMFLVYTWVSYKTDQQKKANFIKNHQIN